MEIVNVSNLGTAAGAVAVIYLMFQSAPKILEAIKPTAKETEDSQVDKFTTAINNNTTAFTELTTFLKTDMAVREVKDTQTAAKMDSIEKKVDEVLAVVNNHSTKCDATCRK